MDSEHFFRPEIMDATRDVLINWSQLTTSDVDLFIRCFESDEHNLMTTKGSRQDDVWANLEIIGFLETGVAIDSAATETLQLRTYRIRQANLAIFHEFIGNYQIADIRLADGNNMRRMLFAQ
jgi:hypothetical protein